MLGIIDVENNKDLLKFVADCETNNDNKTVKDWIKEWIAKDFVKGDCVIIGYARKGQKCFVEFSWE